MHGIVACGPSPDTARVRLAGRAERLAGRLHASLDYGQVDEILSDNPHRFLEGIEPAVPADSRGDSPDLHHLSDRVRVSRQIKMPIQLQMVRPNRKPEA